MFQRVEKFSQAKAIEITMACNGIDDVLLEILRYAGVFAELNDSRTDERLEGTACRSFIIHQPKHSNNRTLWIEMNCKRIRSFGIEAYPVK